MQEASWSVSHNGGSFNLTKTIKKPGKNIENEKKAQLYLCCIRF